MSSGLYTVAHVARYMGKRPQEVARLIDEDGLPAVELPGPKRPVRKIALHGLHKWLAERAVGGAFMSVTELAREMAGVASGDRGVGEEVAA
ncbi:MAG TPA: hypothetical protein PK490_12310 [Prosthecobacter sp.]|nr:hypothetical protein [Prosthecobacter sp.]HRK15070.1 hypothetical protein [Prosthecobacter sp.]